MALIALVAIASAAHAAGEATGLASLGLATPHDLRELSERVPAAGDSPAQILLEETWLQFDVVGRRTRTDRLVYRIDSEDRSPDWAEAGVEWSPWYQQHPRLDAQVISASGSVHLLDPATITESPVASNDPEIYTDDRRLQAPLPAVGKGSIVEEIRAVRDSIVPVAAGHTIRLLQGRFVPSRARRIHIELPVEMPFQYRLEMLPDVAVERTMDGGFRKIEITIESVAALTPIEPGQPPDAPRFPAVVVSTGRSWNEVATRYLEQVETQLTGDSGRDAVTALAQDVARAGPKREPRKDLIERIVHRLHREIRYTGVDLGQSAIRPAYPSETLKRRYGDCKDASLLLVALLRELRIDADLALLLPGPGQDVIAEMPGWGVFSHAIVRLPGPHELWIDATVPSSRLGQLPAGDQGRLALVIHRATQHLVAIPATTAQDNHLLETREFFLSDSSSSRVVETSILEGTPELEYRELYGVMMPSKLQTEMEEYARGAYLSEGTVTSYTTDAQDFSQPFQLVVTAEDARRAYCTLSDAGLMIPRAGLFGRLPNILQYFDADSLDIPGYTNARVHDLMIPTPTTVEWRYRITPPRGYLPDSLPGPVEQMLGPFSYRHEFRAEPSGMVTARFVMTPTLDRLTPADVLAFRKAYAALLRSVLLNVSFHHEGLALATQGRLSEAIRWLREDRDRDSARAIPHMRLATGLLSAALGEAARTEAARAVELAPQNASACQNQAEVLSHDLLGRLYGPGFDRPGAIAAFRKAIELGPKTDQHRAGLAIVLEHNPAGVRYGSGADLDEAIGLYEGLSDDYVEAAGMTNNLPLALKEARRFEELEKWARGPRDPSEAMPMLLCAVAAQHGAEAAVKEAMRIQSDEAARSEALLAAAMSLIGIRRYDAAAELLRAGSRGRENAASVLATADLFARTKPFDPSVVSAEDPRGVYFSLLAAICQDDVTVDRFLSLMSSRVIGSIDSTEVLKQLRQWSKVVLRTFDLPARCVLDLMHVYSDIVVDGDPRVGCRLRVASGPQWRQSMFVKKERGQWRLVDLSNTGALAGLGFEALQAFGRGDTSAARQWLQWAAETQSDVDSMATSPFHVLYSGGQGLSAGRMRAAAAALMAQGDTADSRLAIEALRAERGFTPSEGERRAMDESLATAYLRAGKPDSCLIIVRALRRADAASLALFRLEMAAHDKAKDIAAGRRCAQDRLARDPRDPWALRSLLVIEGEAGDISRVRSLALRLDETQNLSPQDLNNWAWYDLTAGAVTDTTFKNIHRAVLAGTPNPATLNTLAALYAEVNRCAEARDVLLQSLDQRGVDEPESEDWYVLGRMAEQFGLMDTARQAYQRVGHEPGRFGLDSLVSTLAERRLRMLPR